MKSVLASKILPIDFDSHAAALRQTGFDLILTSRARATWTLDSYSLDQFVLEFRNDGGSAIVAGTSPADSITFAVLSAGHPDGGVLNGQRLRVFDLIVIPPAQHLIQATAGPHHWMSVIVSKSHLPHMESSVRESFVRLMDMRRVMVLKSRTLAQKAVANAGAIEETKRDGAPVRRNATLKELEQSLVEILSAAAAAAVERARVASLLRGRKADSYDLARRAIHVLHTSATSPHSVGDFCKALDATERQVRRTFNSFFSMGPARLARLHRLNRVRRRLIEGIPEHMKIMNVLADCEVTEFGRFAGEYKNLFGEMPSETRRKHLIATPRSKSSSASLSLQR